MRKKIQKMKSAYAVAGLICFSIVGPAVGGEWEADDCSNITTSAQVDLCAEVNYRKSNEAMAGALQELENRTKRDYAADEKPGNDRLSLIKKGHKAWIVYRDLNCKLEAFEIEEHSPAFTTTIYNCVIRMNEGRTKHLEMF